MNLKLLKEFCTQQSGTLMPKMIPQFTRCPVIEKEEAIHYSWEIGTILPLLFPLFHILIKLGNICLKLVYFVLGFFVFVFWSRSLFFCVILNTSLNA